MDFMTDLLKRLDTGRDDLRIDITKHNDSSVIFLEILLDRARHLDLVADNPVELVNGDVPDVNVDELNPREARELGLRINLFDFCQEGWHWLFDHLTGIHGDRINNYWAIEGFHILHQLGKRSTELDATIHNWLETDRVNRGLSRLTNHNWTFKYKDHATSKQGLQAMSIWPTIFLTIGYQAAANCAGCWMLEVSSADHAGFDDQWIYMAGYDMTAESWLSIAIEHGNMSLVEYLVERLTKDQINNTRLIEWNWGIEGNHGRRDLGYNETKHPVPSDREEELQGARTGPRRTAR